MSQRRRPRAPLRCRRCGSLNTHIRHVEPDPELLDDLAASQDPDDVALAELLVAAGVDSTVWRVRWCDDCGSRRYSAEIGVDGRQARRRLSQLRAWRPGAHVAGWRRDESTGRAGLAPV